MSGCLPLLIQMPILFGLYQVVYNPLKYLMWYSQETIDKIGDALRTYVLTNYSGIQNLNDPRVQLYLAKAMKERPDLVSFLGTPQTVDFSLFGIDLSVVPQWGFNILILIPILVYVSQALSSYLSFKMNSQIQSTQPGGKAQGLLMTFLLPIMSVWFSFTFPASIGFYWIISNLLMCVQVVILNKYFGLDKLAVQATEAAEKRKEELRTGKRKPSKMQQMAQRALEMQKEQQGGVVGKPASSNIINSENSEIKLNSKGKKSRSQIKEEQRRRLAKARQSQKEN
jgi:YidC/Oxa1 family membrane protein insertase